MIYDLECRYDTRKSFYGKAKVREWEDELSKTYSLYSYNTFVALYTEDKMSNLKIYNYLGKYSQTTTRHQKEFFKQHGLSDNEIKQLMKSGVLEIEN